MSTFRKIIGVFIMIFFAIPILFGVIWAVGLTRAVVSPEFLSDMPQEIIAQVPEVIDQTLKAAEDEEFHLKQNTREWIKAIRQTKTTPRAVLEETGLFKWMQNELTVFFQELGEMLRGEKEIRALKLDMKPLKQAINHPVLDRYVTEVVSGLPPCDIGQLPDWQDVKWQRGFFTSIPPCQPDPAVVGLALASWRSQMGTEIPDEIDTFNKCNNFPRGFRTAQVMISLTYLLFLIPIVIIVIGSLIGAGSRQGFFQWFGLTTIIGGLCALGAGLLAQKFVSLATDWFPFEYSHRFSVEFQNVVLGKMGGIWTSVTDRLFPPVVAVAGVVCIVGLVIFALSFALSSKEPNPEQKPAAV